MFFPQPRRSRSCWRSSRSIKSNLASGRDYLGRRYLPAGRESLWHLYHGTDAAAVERAATEGGKIEGEQEIDEDQVVMVDMVDMVDTVDMADNAEPTAVPTVDVLDVLAQIEKQLGRLGEYHIVQGSVENAPAAEDGCEDRPTMDELAEREGELHEMRKRVTDLASARCHPVATGD